MRVPPSSTSPEPSAPAVVCCMGWMELQGTQVGTGGGGVAGLPNYQLATRGDAWGAASRSVACPRQRHGSVASRSLHCAGFAPCLPRAPPSLLRRERLRPRRPPPSLGLPGAPEVWAVSATTMRSPPAPSVEAPLRVETMPACPAGGWQCVAEAAWVPGNCRRLWTLWNHPTRQEAARLCPQLTPGLLLTTAGASTAQLPASKARAARSKPHPIKENDQDEKRVVARAVLGEAGSVKR